MRKRGENKSRDWIKSFLQVQSKEEYSKMNLIESMDPVLTPRTPIFLLYRIVTMRDYLTGWYNLAGTRRTR
jgi:hypothetical protein